MKNIKDQSTLKVSLYGMSERMQKMMATYLELTCNGVARVVKENEAQAEIVDVDLSDSILLLEERLAQQPPKPVIALSLQQVPNEQVIYLKKPLEVASVLNVIGRVKDILENGKASIKKETAFETTPPAPVYKAIKPVKNVAQEKTAEPDNFTKKRASDFGKSAVLVSPPTNSVEATIIESAEITPLKDNSQKKTDAFEKPEPTTTPPETKPFETVKINSEPTNNNTVGTIIASATSDKDSPSSLADNAAKSSNSDIELSEIANLLKKKKSSSRKKVSPSPPAVPGNIKPFHSSVDKSLEKHQKLRKKQLSPGISAPKGKLDNRRKTIRYAFRAINGRLKKSSLLGFDTNMPILLLIISSKGALIRLNKPIKLGSKVTLEIKFDLQNTFIIPAKVIRKNSRNNYGLAFNKYQHELTNYLINSGRPFNIR